MGKNKVVSILLATHNGEKFLEEQLESLLKQTYTGFTVYISDDCSTDFTSKIISKYCIMDSRFIDIHNSQPFGNARDNFLSMLSQIDSDLYMFCDQDDVWLPNKIEKMINAYTRECNDEIPSLVYCDMKIVDENLEVLHKSNQAYMGTTLEVHDFLYYLTANNIAGCSMLINKKLADMFRVNTSVFNLTTIIMHDFFFAQLASIAGKIIYVNESLQLYRQHGSNAVGANKKCFPSYIIEKLNIKNSKNQLIKCEKQLQEILKIPRITDFEKEKLDICIKFSHLYKKRKFTRISFFIKNHLFKGNILQKFYQLLKI